METYDLAARLLHRIALGTGLVRQAAFDLDQAVGTRLWPVDQDILEGRTEPVFVTGLARAGTTLVLQRLYDSGHFATLTYRDMPFVLAPRLWQKLSARFRRQGTIGERAHADGVLVGFDSPEAFEEVFWLTFAGDLYLHGDCLSPHEAPDELAGLFRRYVGMVLASTQSTPDAAVGVTRYLSKNNNNVLRLAALRKAFPMAHIVVPFRNPDDHASSLHRQHLRFQETLKNDRFGRDYMRWLGHFEFGIDHRPFAFGDWLERRHALSPANTQYWFAYWSTVYGSLLEQEDPDLLFLDFDALCANPEAVWPAFYDQLGLPAGAKARGPDIATPAVYDPVAVDRPEDRRTATEIHARLVDRAKRSLSKQRATGTARVRPAP